MKAPALFPQRLGELMERNAMSQAELARRTGIPLATLRSYLAGRRETVSTRNLLLFAQAFEMPMSELIDVFSGVVNLDKK